MFMMDRKEHDSLILDPKHVSATMMVVYDNSSRVRICCIKNEGLDKRTTLMQDNATEHSHVLDIRRNCMECIPQAGKASQRVLKAVS